MCNEKNPCIIQNIVLPFQCGFNKWTKYSNQVFLLLRCELGVTAPHNRDALTSSSMLLAPHGWWFLSLVHTKKTQAGKAGTFRVQAGYQCQTGGSLSCWGSCYFKERRNTNLPVGMRKLLVEFPAAGERNNDAWSLLCQGLHKKLKAPLNLKFSPKWAAGVIQKVLYTALNHHHPETGGMKNQSKVLSEALPNTQVSLMLRAFVHSTEQVC